MQNFVALTANLAVLPPREAWLMAYMTGRCHTGTIQAWGDAAKTLTESRSGRVHLLLFVDTPATIGPRGRAATTELITALHGRVSALVLVLNANGLWRAMFRAAVGAGLIRAKRDFPVSIVGSIAEAEAIFAAQGAVLAPDSAASALEVMRQATAAEIQTALKHGDRAAIVPGKSP